ncbi:MAG TPA: NAD-dependent epimerase/dehydratase family protein [Spirochaetia bacterium]|nr:NAD-dependent epimerase/dehydratase family protein [Spirochaetia bacterium]
MNRDIDDEDSLEEALSRPSSYLINLFRALEGDILILGIGGKIGPSLGATAVRAAREAGASTQVLGAARFSDRSMISRLSSWGIEPIVCDLSNEDEVNRLPKVKNVVFMAGRKFGTTGGENTTWAMNAVVPSIVARSFRESRIVVFSTGCVYPLVSPSSGGCTEDDPAQPVGEYSFSCLARERIFSYYSEANGTPCCLLRLNYAIDLRYGVLHDIAERIWNDQAVSLEVPAVNVIWQGDVNNQALAALSLCASPPQRINVTGPETLSIRRIALELGELLGKEVAFEGSEGDTALLSDSSRAVEMFGYPRVGVRQMMRWTAEWVARGGRSLGKPTHFEVSDGRY